MNNQFSFAVRNPEAIRQALLARQELALVDVREEAPFATSHPLFAVNIPFSRLEIEVGARIPRLTTPITLYDNGEGLALAAALRLVALGYTDVALLKDGLAGWKAANLPLEQGETETGYCPRGSIVTGGLMRVQRYRRPLCWLIWIGSMVWLHNWRKTVCTVSGCYNPWLTEHLRWPRSVCKRSLLVDRRDKNRIKGSLGQGAGARPHFLRPNLKSIC